MNDTQHPQVRVAASAINWHNDDFPILGADTSVDSILSDMRRAGFHGTELSSFFPPDAKKLKEQLDHHSLQLAAGWHSAYILTRDFNDERARFKASATFLKSVGATHITIAECSYCPFKPYSQKPFDEHLSALRVPLFPRHVPSLSAADWKKLAAGLTEFTTIASDQGMTLGYHPHIQTVVENEHDLDTLVNAVPTLDLTIDTGHLMLSGANPVDIVKKYLPKVKHLHVKNVRERVADAARDGFMGFEFAVIEGVFTVPGDGGVDFPAIFDLLKLGDYQGWIVVEAEQNPLTANPYLYATLGREYIRSVATW